MGKKLKEIESKNRLMKPIDSVLVFVLYKSRFRFKFIKYKIVVLVNQPKNKKDTKK